MLGASSSASAPVATVAINRRPVHSPWGGGNQWLEQMERSLRFNGYDVRYDLNQRVDCIVVADPRVGPTASFDIHAIADYKTRHPGVPCIQRVNDNDKHRGTSDRDPFQAAGARVADHVVFVSEWLRDYEAERWFDATRSHSVILNGANPRFFHPIGGATYRPGETFRIVTHHWSKDWNKGFAVYQELDRLIASGELTKIELWIIGRWPDEIAWKSARTFPPARPADIARLLRQCHVYLTASRWESGGMHFIEGAQCGLPIIYQTTGGGIVEMANRFGVPFTEDVKAAVETMRARYDALREAVLVGAPSGDRMCLEYRRLIEQLVARAAPVGRG